MSLEEYKSRMTNLEEQQKQRQALDGINTTQKEMLVDQEEQTKAFESMAKSMSEIAKLMGGTNGTYDNLILANLDGTKEKYEAMQRAWFKANGAAKATSEELTALVDKWYQMTRTLVKDWDGWTRFSHPDVSSISTGTKMGSNENMVCEPSTESLAGQDDYAGNPLFAITYCNWKMKNNQPVITAIKDISPDFDFYDEDKLVGVLQMSGYIHWTELDESSDHYDRGYSATLKPYSHIEPLPESVRPDGTIREWVLHGACPAGVKDDGTYCECYGVEPSWHGMNHNNINTVTKKMGDGISGTCSCDLSFLKLMTNIKYASLTLDTIMNGCFSYWASDTVALAETGVKRVLLNGETSADKYIVGSYCRIDNWDGKLDEWSLRNQNTTAITGTHGVKITDVKKVTVNDTEYLAVYVDTDSTFSTSTDSGSQTKIMSWIWNTGSTANVKGNDGAIELKSAKYAIKLQGIEFALGQYEIITDTLLRVAADSNDDYWYQPYIVKAFNKRGSTVTDDYTECDAKFKATGTWSYIKHEKRSNSVEFPDMGDGSSSTFHRDGIYTVKKEGVFQILAFGSLTAGSGNGGLSCLNGDSSPTDSYFHCGSRLSPNGTRG